MDQEILKEIIKEDVNLDQNFIDVNYVFRVSFKNLTDSHYFVEL